MQIPERNEKLRLLGKLKDLEESGAVSTKSLTMENNLEEIQFEYVRQKEMVNDEEIFTIFYMAFVFLYLASYQ